MKMRKTGGNQNKLQDTPQRLLGDQEIKKEVNSGKTIILVGDSRNKVVNIKITVYRDQPSRITNKYEV